MLQSGVTLGSKNRLTANDDEPKALALGTPVSAASGPEIVWPVCGIVTASFGVPHRPWQATHTGIDIANSNGRSGDDISPFKKGVVITADSSVSTGWGKHVIVDHGNNITSLYGHMSGVNVKVGQRVTPGDTIGWEGSTGNSTGPHVHFEIRKNGAPVDPRDLVRGNPGC